MSNLIEFFRMVLSYLMVFAVIIVVSAVGAFVGLKCWKQKPKAPKENEQ
jgi:hypothetical protein